MKPLSLAEIQKLAVGRSCVQLFCMKERLFYSLTRKKGDRWWQCGELLNE